MLESYHLFTEEEQDELVAAWFEGEEAQARMYAVLKRVRARFEGVRYLPVEKERLPREIQDQIDMESWGIRKTHEGGIELERGPEGLEPRGAKGHATPPPEERDRLSEIIKELNDRYGAGLTEEDRLSLETLEKRLTGAAALQAAARSNTRNNVRLTFGTKVQDYLQDMADSNFKLYKRITDDREFGRRLLDLLFEEFWQEVGEG